MPNLSPSTWGTIALLSLFGLIGLGNWIENYVRYRQGRGDPLSVRLSNLLYGSSIILSVILSFPEYTDARSWLRYGIVLFALAGYLVSIRERSHPATQRLPEYPVMPTVWEERWEVVSRVLSYAGVAGALVLVGATEGVGWAIGLLGIIVSIYMYLAYRKKYGHPVEAREKIV